MCCKEFPARQKLSTFNPEVGMDLLRVGGSRKTRQRMTG